MNQLKVEVSPADVLCMIPSVGLMAESKEELENVAHVVAVAFAKFYVSFPEAAEFLGVRFLEEAFKEGNEASVKVIRRSIDSAVDKGFITPLE